MKAVHILYHLKLGRRFLEGQIMVLADAAFKMGTSPITKTSVFVYVSFIF